MQQVHDAGRGHQGAVGRRCRTQLQRRSDLIPEPGRDGEGLRGARRRSVFKDIADARAALCWQRSRRRKRSRRRTSRPPRLGRLLAVVENYPNLKANEQFNRLHGRAAPAPRTGSRSRACATTSACRIYNAATRREFPGERDREGVRLQAISVLGSPCRRRNGAAQSRFRSSDRCRVMMKRRFRSARAALGALCAWSAAARDGIAQGGQPPAPARRLSRSTRVGRSDPAATSRWRSIGPANMGGRIDDIAVVESNPSIVLRRLRHRRRLEDRRTTARRSTPVFD